MVQELNKTNFDQALKDKSPLIVDFWAPWCGPCRELSPRFEKLSTEFHQKLRFAKINVDDNGEVAAKYGVRGIPCLIMFNNGKETDRIVGALSEVELRKKLDLSLAKLM